MDNKYFAKRRENILQEKYDEALEEQRIQKMEEERRAEKVGSRWAEDMCHLCANYHDCMLQYGLTGQCSAFTKK